MSRLTAGVAAVLLAVLVGHTKVDQGMRLSAPDWSNLH